MSDTTNWAERRQFGRRPLHAEATAELPGSVEVPCIIENLSEGGALLSFPTGVAPIQNFELAVADVPFKLPCEMRYQVGIRFGVRFLHLDQGEALIRHFFKPAATPEAGTSPRRIEDREPAASGSVRQLRETLLPLIAPEPTSTAPEETDAEQDATVKVARLAQPPAPAGRFARLLGRR